MRPLQASDVSERYLSWFSDATVVRYIEAAKHQQTQNTLRRFVEEKWQSPGALLLGIFAARGGHHLGNIKFEPIDFDQGAAVVGVLIGEPDWRGQGVFPEAFAAAAGYLRAHCGISVFWLGVDASNAAAVTTYARTGFVDAAPPAYLVPHPASGVRYMSFAAPSAG